VEVKSGKSVTVVAEDEEYKKAKLDKIPTLKPAFKPDGDRLLSIYVMRMSSVTCGACGLMGGTRFGDRSQRIQSERWGSCVGNHIGRSCSCIGIEAHRSYSWVW
jgi:hypothetical protein